MNPIVLGISGLLHRTGIPIIGGPYWPSWTDGKTTANSLALRGTLKKFVQRTQFQRFDGVLSPTAASTAELLRMGVDYRQIFPLNVGIDTDLFSPGPRKHDSPVILFLANLQKRKGIFVLLEAFEQIAARLPSSRLVVGGSGPDAEVVKQRVSQMACSKQITLLGHVNRHQIAETLRACSVYCLPSFGEPFGMSALEAMSCGKPLVVTNSGGLNDLVRDSGGHKIAPGDVNGLALALENILRNPSLGEHLGQSNRELVLAEYGWDRVMDRLEAIYDHLVQPARQHLSGLVESGPTFQ